MVLQARKCQLNHDINKIKEIYLGQCASFVGKDVLNLSKIIGQIPAASERSLLLMHHLVVKVNKCGLACPDKLDGNV